MILLEKQRTAGICTFILFLILLSIITIIIGFALKMHGRIRRETEKTQEEILEDRQKALKYRQLQDMCLSLKEKNDYSETALKLSQQLLMMNPDVTTVWNYRSSYVKKTLDELKEDSEKRRELISKELELTKRIIQTKDTKCYPLWHYRKWLFTLEPNLLTKTEVDLCEQLLKVDERNFHCWNYWKYVSDLLKLTPEELLNFTYKRIEHNFSNYSAWSYRLSILVHSYEKNLLKEDIRTHIDNELELILNAVYTEPDDQSAWYYQKSLFDYLLSSTIYSQDELHTMIENRINEIQELIEVEPDCQMAKDCLKLLEQLL